MSFLTPNFRYMQYNTKHLKLFFVSPSIWTYRYNQARKVAYVPFPFPHTQLTSLYVLLMLGFLPVLMLSYVENVIVAAIFNLMSVTVLVGESAGLI